jgi:hypothetical protein
VNFGLFAGREATQAEVEALARIVQQEVRSATIRREHHLEVNDDQITASLHEVVIEVPDEVTAEHHPLVLRERLIHLATQWVRGCKEDPGEPQTLAERLARQAVIDADATHAERAPDGV